MKMGPRLMFLPSIFVPMIESGSHGRNGGYLRSAVKKPCSVSLRRVFVQERGVHQAALRFARVQRDWPAAPDRGAAEFAAPVEGIKPHVEIGPAIVVDQPFHFRLMHDAFTGRETGLLRGFALAYELHHHHAAARQQIRFASAGGASRGGANLLSSEEH